MFPEQIGCFVFMFLIICLIGIMLTADVLSVQVLFSDINAYEVLSYPLLVLF